MPSIATAPLRSNCRGARPEKRTPARIKHTQQSLNKPTRICKPPPPPCPTCIATKQNSGRGWMEGGGCNFEWICSKVCWVCSWGGWCKFRQFSISLADKIPPCQEPGWCCICMQWLWWERDTCTANFPFCTAALCSSYMSPVGLHWYDPRSPYLGPLELYQAILLKIKHE